MRVRRELAIALGVALTVAGSLRAVPAVAQDPSPAPTGPLCLLTVAEMTDLLGVPIATLAAADGECAYSANLTQRQVQVVLSAIVPVNVASAPTGDPLLTIRYGPTAHGKDTKIAGRPAWVADDGAWVDVGAEVLGVWLNTAFDDDPPPPKVAISIAKTVVPMYLAAPRPSPTPRAGLPGRFPSSLAGSRLGPFPYPPADYLSMVESMGPPGGDHVGELRDAIVALGTTVDALQVLDASAYDSSSRSRRRAWTSLRCWLPPSPP